MTHSDWHFERSRWWQLGGQAGGGKTADQTSPGTGRDDKTGYKARARKVGGEGTNFGHDEMIAFMGPGDQVNRGNRGKQLWRCC